MAWNSVDHSRLAAQCLASYLTVCRRPTHAQLLGSMPRRSFTAFPGRCLQPGYLSVVWTETWPDRNWIWSSSPPASRHRRAQGAGPTQVMRGQVFNGCPPGEFLDDLPHDPLRYATCPGLARPANAPKHATFAHSSGCEPGINRRFDPVRDADGPNMPGLADRIDDCPAPLIHPEPLIQCL
jgi:hypothetical protein